MVKENKNLKDLKVGKKNFLLSPGRLARPRIPAFRANERFDLMIAKKAGDPGSNPGRGIIKNFSFKT